MVRTKKVVRYVAMHVVNKKAHLKGPRSRSSSRMTTLTSMKNGRIINNRSLAVLALIFWDLVLFSLIAARCPQSSCGYPDE